MKIIVAGIVGAVVLFIWSSISWMVLPWHKQTLHSFKDTAAVASVLQVNTGKSGIYIMPNYDENTAVVPRVFAVVSLEGMPKMNTSLIVSFIVELAVALLVASLLAKTAITCYFARVGFIVVFALAAAILGSLPYWNWWGFELNYTLVTMADVLIGWFLAGLAMAALVKPQCAAG